MKQRKKRLPGPDAEGILPYRIDPEPLGTPATSFSGLPLVAEAFRAFAGHESCKRHLHLKQRARGLTEAQILESLLLMITAGGEHLDDLARLLEDPALPTLLGYRAPSADTGLRFLYAFHDEALLAQRPSDALSWIPPESEALAGLDHVLADVLQAGFQVLPTKGLRVATLEHDATLIESHKREAYRHYDGGRGYQPAFVLWNEQDLLLADEFRDGNVPAGASNLPLVRRAFERLPDTVEQRYFRADSACYDHAVMRYLKEEGIGFAISADLSPPLKAHIEALPEKAWHPLDEGREWAEVPLFVPGDALREAPPLPPSRYLAIRTLPRQLELFNKGGYRYWAVVTTLPWRAPKILAWHRQKAGAIEHAHRELKGALALGVLPCGRFGADAAWCRLNVLLYNLLSLLKRTALPRPLREARTKRLRYEIFQLAGLVIRHARCTRVRLAAGAARIAALIRARHQLAGIALLLRT